MRPTIYRSLLLLLTTVKVENMLASFPPSLLLSDLDLQPPSHIPKKRKCPWKDISALLFLPKRYQRLKDWPKLKLFLENYLSLWPLEKPKIIQMFTNMELRSTVDDIEWYYKKLIN